MTRDSRGLTAVRRLQLDGGMQPIQHIDRANLEHVTGGVDIGGIASMIGGLVDKFGNTGGKASQIASTIGNIAQQFQGSGGSSGASSGE